MPSAFPATESKKETAKVPPSAAGSKSGLPQASVHLQKKPAASVSAGPISKPVSKSTSASSAITVAPQVQPEPGVGVGVGIIALAASLVAVGIQLWMILG
jgi:hypothetical protein